jgi:hypothetical protein
MEALGPELLQHPVAPEPILDRVLDLGEVQLDAGGVEVVVQLWITSAAEVSTSVTGSAATTTRRAAVGEAATASRTSWPKTSALAKNNGASQRNSISPGTRLAAGGLRFAVADQIADITDRYVVLNLPVEDTERLGRPQAPAVYHADPSEHAGGSLHDWFGRNFGRGHWKRDR